MNVLVDLTRLLSRSGNPTPTGIDRVEIAYAKRYLAGESGGDAVAITRWGALILPRQDALGLVRRLDERWTGDTGEEAHGEAAGLQTWLAGKRPEPAIAQKPPRAPRPSLSDMLHGLLPLGRGAAAHAPPDATYLHVSHLRLDKPEAFAWLDRRPDVRAVFFVHDLIPIEHPEHSRPEQVVAHARRMETVATRAAAVLVSSQDVAKRFRRHLDGRGLPVPPVHVVPLGLDPAFQATTAGAAAPKPAGRPYCVVCGTLESRKNHLFLLQVWRDLAQRLGADTPGLVVIGQPGWGGESALDFLRRCEALRPHVLLASGLPSREVRGAMAGARALLMPSFAEGFGLPVVEALSLGVPVIASDLPSHREVAGDRATFLHPLDGPGWREAALAAARRPAGSALREAYRAPAWDEHFAAVDALLRAGSR